MGLTSKIAQLPPGMRDQVSEYLDAGRPEADIADWLNLLIRADPALTQKPGEITQQNVNTWRHTGYKHWLAERKAKEIAGQIDEKETGGQSTAERDSADNLALWLVSVWTSELLELEAAEQVPKPERRERLVEITKSITALRKGQAAKAWVRIEAARLKIEQERHADWLSPGKRNMERLTNLASRGLTMETVEEIGEKLQKL